MGHYSNGNCFPGTWSYSCPVQTSQDHWPLNWAISSISWMTFWHQRAKNLHPQIMLTPFSEHASREEARNSDMPTQNTDDLTSSSFPTPQTTLLLYPINIPSPSPLVRQIQDLFSHLLIQLPHKQTLSLLQTPCPSVRPAMHWVNGPGLITQVMLTFLQSFVQ